MVDKGDKVTVTAYKQDYVVDVTKVESDGFWGDFKNLSHGTEGYGGRFPWNRVTKFEVVPKPIGDGCWVFIDGERYIKYDGQWWKRTTYDDESIQKDAVNGKVYVP